MIGLTNAWTTHIKMINITKREHVKDFDDLMQWSTNAL